MVLRLLIPLVLCGLGLAADLRLDALRSSLIGMRGKPQESSHLRGATPQLTAAKHQLRDWVESRLMSLAQTGDEGEFQRKLNSELRGSQLFCGEKAADQNPCPDWTLLGFLHEFRFRRSLGFLILQAAVGIEFGFDESAYLYSWSDEGWRRVWRTSRILTRKRHTDRRVSRRY